MSGLVESLLEELLQEMKNNTSAVNTLQRLMGGSGGGSPGGAGGGGSPGGGSPGGGAGGGPAGSGSAFANRAAFLFGRTIGFAGGLVSVSFKSLSTITKSLAQSQMSLAETAISGTGVLSSFLSSLESLPFGLGFVARTLNYQVRQLEVNIATFQKLSQTGAALGGNLEEVRRSAKSMYLSMDEFASVMKENAPYLLNFGSTADEGARALIRFNSQMIKSPVGKQLLSMGYSLEEANNMLGLYTASMGGLNRNQIRNQAATEKSVKSFAQELALSAELQGKTREQAANELKERQKNAVRENLLSAMNAQQKEAYFKAENRALAMGGKGAADALLASVAGIKTPLTKEAQELAALNTDTYREAIGMGDTVRDTTLSLDQKTKMLNQSFGRGSQSMAKMAEKYGAAGTVIALRGSELSDAMMAAHNAEARARNLGLKSAEDYANQIDKINTELEAAQKANVGTQVQIAGRAKYQGEWLMNLLFTVVKPFEKVLIGLTTAFATVTPKVLNFISDFTNTVISPIIDMIFKPFTSGAFNKPFADFSKGFGSLNLSKIFGDLKKPLESIIKSMTDFVTQRNWEKIGQIFKGLTEVITNVVSIISILLKPVLTVLGGLFDLTIIALKPMVGILNSLLKGFIEVTNWLKTVLEPIFAKLKPLWDKFSSGFEAGMAKLEEKFKNLENIGSTLSKVFWALVASSLALKASQFIAGGGLTMFSRTIIGSGVNTAKGLLGVVGRFASNIFGIVPFMGRLIGAGIVKVLAAIGAGISTPIAGIVAAIASLGAVVVAFREYGWKMSTVIEALSDKFSGVTTKMGGVFDALLTKLPTWMGGITEEEFKKRKAIQLAKEMELRKREQQRDAAREKNVAEMKAKGTDARSLLKKGADSIGNFFSSEPSQIPKPKNKPSSPNTPAGSKPPTSKPTEPSKPEINPDLLISPSPYATEGSVDSKLANDVIRALRDISDNIKRTNNLIASNGNLFRR